MIGATFAYDLFKDKYDDLEPFEDSAFEGIKHHEGLCVLFDGMNGEYVAIGKVLAKSRDGDGLCAPLVIRTTDEETATVAQAIDKFICPIVELPAFKVTPLVISHYR